MGNRCLLHSRAGWVLEPRHAGQCPQMTPIELAFVIDDPVGEDALLLAVAVLRLIEDRRSGAQMRWLASELDRLNAENPRRYVTRSQVKKTVLRRSVRCPECGRRTGGKTLGCVACAMRGGA